MLVSLIGSAHRRKPTPPAGNWPPYVRACLRRSLRLRAVALGVSVVGTAFFAHALWWRFQWADILGMRSVLAAGFACAGQFGVSVCLAVELYLAAKEQHKSA